MTFGRVRQWRTRRLLCVSCMLMVCGCRSTVCEFRNVTPAQVGAAVAEAGGRVKPRRFFSPSVRSRKWSKPFRDRLCRGEGGTVEWREMVVFIFHTRSVKDRVRLRPLGGSDEQSADGCKLKIRSTARGVVCFVHPYGWLFPQRLALRERNIVRDAYRLLSADVPQVVAKPRGGLRLPQPARRTAAEADADRTNGGTP